MTKPKIITDVLTNDATAIGVINPGGTFGLSQEDRKGNMLVLGRSGTGKSVLLETLLISDLVNSRGGLFIDPYGDLINDALQYANKKNVIIFEADKGDAEFNINKFKQEVDLAEIKNSKFVLCKISYQIIGSHVAREVGMYILNEYYKLKSDLNNTSLFIDEFHNFVNKEYDIAANKKYGIKCHFSDQSINQYSDDDLQQLFNVIDHVVCFTADGRTAKQVGKGFGFNPEDLVNLEKFNFYAKLTVSGEKTNTFKAKGLFPIPYPKNS